MRENVESAKATASAPPPEENGDDSVSGSGAEAAAAAEAEAMALKEKLRRTVEALEASEAAKTDAEKLLAEAKQVICVPRVGRPQAAGIKMARLSFAVNSTFWHRIP